jgi:hypothetical protein
MKYPRTGTGLTLVYSDLQGTRVCIVAMRIIHLLGVLQVPSPSMTIMVVASMIVGSSSSGIGGAEPSSWRAHPWSFLPVFRVLYPGYRRTPIMTQPRNPARDMLGLPAAMPGGFQYQEHKYPDGQHSIEYPSPEASHLVESCHCPLQRWDKTVPGRTDSKNRSGQIKPTPVDVSYAAPQAHAIINVVVHREYSPGIIFIFS